MFSMSFKSGSNSIPGLTQCWGASEQRFQLTLICSICWACNFCLGSLWHRMDFQGCRITDGWWCQLPQQTGFLLMLEHKLQKVVQEQVPHLEGRNKSARGPTLSSAGERRESQRRHTKETTPGIAWYSDASRADLGKNLTNQPKFSSAFRSHKSRPIPSTSHLDHTRLFPIWSWKLSLGAERTHPVYHAAVFA